jgi:hypothetical protein
MSEKDVGAVGNGALRGCERAARASAILAALAAGAILIPSPASALPKLNDQLEVNDVLYDLPSFAVNSCLAEPALALFRRRYPTPEVPQ